VIRAVAVDLDGTLLRSDKSVSARAVAALAATVAAGVRVVIVTARPPRFARVLAREAGISGVAVCSNGAIVCDLDTGDVTIVGPLPMVVAQQTASVIANVMAGVAFAVETGHCAFVGPGFGPVATRDADGVSVASAADLWASSQTCVKLLAWSPAPVTDARVAQLRSLLPEITLTYSGGAGMMEISGPGVSKVDTLERLCAQWGIDAQEVMAFGDMPNDLSTLRWAGTGVAVANAHPDVLACADLVTASNNDDGVAAVLEELFARPKNVVPAS
jgi:Cof subfamily protein (haloacid dehalogenase superfamily)